MKKIKSILSKIPKKFRFPIFFLVGAIVVCVVFGIVFGTILHFVMPQDRYVESVLMWSKIFFFFVGFPIVIHAALCLIVGQDDFPVGFAAGLYFGTIFLANFLRKFIVTLESNLYIISFVIVGLICFATWCSKFKNKKD